MPSRPTTKQIIENIVAIDERKSKSPKSGKLVAKSPGSVKYGKK